MPTRWRPALVTRMVRPFPRVRKSCHRGNFRTMCSAVGDVFEYTLGKIIAPHTHIRGAAAPSCNRVLSYFEVAPYTVLSMLHVVPHVFPKFTSKILSRCSALQDEIFGRQSFSTGGEMETLPDAGQQQACRCRCCCVSLN